MLAAVILLLIQICIAVLLIYLVLYVLEVLGIALPPKVIQILWIIVMLVVLYLVVVQLLPMAGLGGKHLLMLSPALLPRS